MVSAALLEAPANWFPKAVGLHIAGIPVRKKVAVDFGDTRFVQELAERSDPAGIVVYAVAELAVEVAEHSAVLQVAAELSNQGVVHHKVNWS